MHNTLDVYVRIVELPVQAIWLVPAMPARASGFPSNGDQLMPSSVVASRTAAFIRQDGRCFYCDHLMWLSEIQEYSSRHRLSLAQARGFQCTAEHLLARCDGGGDARTNIVAACLTCNKRRHARKKSMTVQAYCNHVRSRVCQGRWHAATPRRLPPNSVLLSDAIHLRLRRVHGASECGR